MNWNIFKTTDLPLENFQEANELSKKTYNINILQSDIILGKDVMNDLEVFHPYDNASFRSTVYYIFQEKCSTIGSKTFLEELLKNPLCNISNLNKRKECLNTLSNVDPNTYNHLLSQLKKTETDFLWFFSQNEKTVDELINSIYFSFWILNKLNNHPVTMTSYNFYKIMISPVLGILSPVIYFIIPFIILKYKFGHLFKMSFFTYVKMLYKSMTMSSNVLNLLNSGNSMLSRLQIVTYILSFLFYFQGIINTVNVSQTAYKIVEFISNKVNNAFTYLKSCIQLNDNIWKNVILPFEDSFVSKKIPSDDESIIQMLRDYKPFSSFTIFSHFGDQLVKYKNFNQFDFLNIVNKSYIIDALISIISVKNEHELSFTKYNTSLSDTFVNSKKAWHLCVNKDVSVKNDFNFKNALITGPNAGGKSTLIKTLCLNVLLAQTITLTASEYTEMTPFFFINTQINIPDSKGVESLFEAEMNRCLYILSVINKHPDEKSLIVMDEIFNSTNIIEAIAGAYSILQKISEFKNVMTVITTHFIYLTKLKKETSFVCYKMNVNIKKDHSINFPYILSKGISKQYVALELLKGRGFDESILNNAMAIKNKLAK